MKILSLLKLITPSIPKKDSSFSLEASIISRTNLDSKIKHPIYSIEFNIEELKESFKSDIPTILPKFNNIKYSQISEFPSVKRDLSFQIKDTKNIDTLVKLLTSFENDYLKESFIFATHFHEISNYEEIKQLCCSK